MNGLRLGEYLSKTLAELKISEGPEYMPQTGKTENVIKFNYFMGDQLINVKYRDGRKNFKLYKGAEKVFYNINSIIGYEYCVIVEGEMDVLSVTRSWYNKCNIGAKRRYFK